MTGTTDLAAIARGLTKAQRAMITGRHSDSGNPWPFIGVRQRAGGAASRMFDKLIAAGLYDRGNNLTADGLALRHHLQELDNAPD